MTSRLDSSGIAAVAGYPIVVVPMGFTFGLPLGLSFFGGAYSEPMLIKLAYGFEQATHHRREPQFLPTLPLTAPPQPADDGNQVRSQQRAQSRQGAGKQGMKARRI